MGQFFKMLFAVIIGMFLFLFLIIGIFAGIGLAAGNQEVVEVKPNSILELDLNYDIPEKTSENPFAQIDFINFKPEKLLGLNDLKKVIREAAKDDKIKGIYLPLGINENGLSTLQGLRNELKAFKKSGKFILSHGQVATQKSYYLCSVADKIYMEPSGVMELNGFGRQITYFKGFFEKIGVEILDFHEGTYKSFVEPFIRNNMSDANREQLTYLYSDIYQNFSKDIATSRKMDTAQLNAVINGLKVTRAKQALEHKMVDALKFGWEVNDELKKKTGVKADDKPEMVDPVAYFTTLKNEGDFNNRIAVIVAEGDIVDGEGSEGEIGGDAFAEEVRKAADDKKVKAIVLRVNSPGGSAMASDLIWSELVRAKKKKPVVATFGDVAASGGYYIACPAEKIFVEPFTITGSIGVFGLIPNAQKLFNEKLGVTFDEVEFNDHAVIGGFNKPMDPVEDQAIRESIKQIYLDFKEHVARGRKMSIDTLENYAQGRVWTGQQAIDRGLADEMGSLEDAVAFAAKQANVKDYRIRYYPEEKSLRDQLMEGLSKAREDQVKAEAGEFYPLMKQLKTLRKMKGVQMRMAYDLD